MLQSRPKPEPRWESLKCHSPLLYFMADWDSIRKAASKDIGKIRGVYVLEDSDRRELLKLIKETDTTVVLPLAAVRDIFYRGSGSPSAAAMSIGLRKHFGDEFTFGVRGSGSSLVIGIKKK